jgi:transcriptional regulator with XRE-family HTH domain
VDEVRRLRLEKGWSQNELAYHAKLAPSVISLIETGKRDPNATTLRKLASALEVRIPDLFEESGSGKAQRRSSYEPSFNDVLEEERLEATGRSPEARIEVSNTLANSLDMLSAGFREALEQRPAAPVEEIFALFMQASLAHVGAQTIAEDAGYADDTEGDSPAESVAKERMRAALDELSQVSDELEQAMATAEAAQELPEGVALLARFRRAV